ncbi:hypothetical protein [Aeromonas sp. Prich7-2]|uniref:hypothetical protein n=1 Tax=Aeromonas sp. Prich7-2 TaxID=2823361 RepID=UPI001FF0C1FF|nr:hypothetical protein [Aeromonas sp. Prich7-2]
MKEAQKEWAGAALTARPEVGFRGENNVDKRTEAGAKAQGKRRNVIPAVIPRLVESQGQSYLVYGGLLRGIKIPATKEQAKRHLNCLMQHLQEVAHG